jgi:hypothetical protein
MMRSVSDKRFHYIKNFFPGRPYAQHIEYMEEMPTMKEMRRVYKDHMNALDPNYGKAMTPAQLLFFRPEKPVEELYDVTVDPHEINNLAALPQHQETLKRMRAALIQWQKETKDLGLVPELELRERMRPGGVWQKVATPTISPRNVGDKTVVTITCPTEGASIAYTTETGPTARWKLYSGELTLPAGTALRAKGCRFGYLDSDEARR